jgi:hypothetical protein
MNREIVDRSIRVWYDLHVEKVRKLKPRNWSPVPDPAPNAAVRARGLGVRLERIHISRQV